MVPVNGRDLNPFPRLCKHEKCSDRGARSGMDAQTKVQIFDPFFTTKGKEGGTGLGLTTVYTIIKGHEGAIDVVSEPGEGATFNIYLPASTKIVDTVKAEEREILTGTETILIVDDEDLNREVTGELVEAMGYRV
ncbi:MAG TPA: ATP-binding protein [Syntrophales bacterium]|nr:ATP-binding protein [Syntrophales bacterium]HQG33763.1 ATP-binding protein [Syntrophales bacterium]HRU88200.1 ATP-binding protein [Syntrophales bacterium]